MGLSDEELRRYSRHLVLQGFGVDKQLQLKRAKVLIVGAGGLGSPVLLYLAAAGVGTLGIADADNVDLSNLQRQVLYATDDIGRNKAITSAEKITKLNPGVRVETWPERVTGANALRLLKNYDVVVDGSDNFPTRYLLNDACVMLNKPLVYGSILRFEGQVAVFNYEKTPGVFTANYRDIFPEPPDPSTVPDCEQAGVIGVLPGIIGCLQANEVIKLITGIGQPLADQLLLFDIMSMQQTLISLRNLNARNAITSLVDYEEFCGGNQNKNESLKTKKSGMKEVTVQELKNMIAAGEDFQLIDVREPHEYDICNLGGELIPQAEIPHNVDRIEKNKKVVVHCRSGARSGNMVQWLEKNTGMTNLYNLKGGILAWANEIDASMPKY